jgi:hypothetical protein
MEYDMDIVTNVRLRLDDQYTFSISQEAAPRNLVEVALLYKRDGVKKGFVPCNEWAENWVGAEYDDDVIRMLNGHDVADLLQFAKEYVYIKDNR